MTHRQNTKITPYKIAFFLLSEQDGTALEMRNGREVWANEKIYILYIGYTKVEYYNNWKKSNGIPILEFKYLQQNSSNG